MLARTPKCLQILLALVLLKGPAKIFSGFDQVDQKLSLTGNTFSFDNPMNISSSFPNRTKSRSIRGNRHPLRNLSFSLTSSNQLNPQLAGNHHQKDLSSDEEREEDLNEEEQENPQNIFAATQDESAANHQWNEHNQSEADSAGVLSRGAENLRSLTTERREALEALDSESIIGREVRERGGDQQSQLNNERERRESETQERDEDPERQQQNASTHESLCDRRVLVFFGASKYMLGRVSNIERHGSNEEVRFRVIFDVKSHGSPDLYSLDSILDKYYAIYSLDELLDIIRPPSGEDNLYKRTGNRLNLWDRGFNKYVYVRNLMVDRGLDSFKTLADEDAVIRELCNLRTNTVINHENLKNSIKNLQKNYHSDRLVSEPKRVKFVLQSVFKVLSYILESSARRQQIGSGSQGMSVAPSLSLEFPEYGSRDFYAQANLQEAEEDFTQQEEGEGVDNNYGADGDAYRHRDNVEYDRLGHDIPWGPSDLTARLENGLLVNDWSAVDAIDLGKVESCPFKVVKNIPKESMSVCREATKKLMSRLIIAINIPLGHPHRTNILRRAYAWYSLFSSLCLRDTGKSYYKTTKDISERLQQILNDNLGPLINKWEKDYRKETAKSRKIPVDTPAKRLKRAVTMIKTTTPHCISKAFNLIRGNGSTSCDVPAVRQQMLDKHPSREINWAPHVREEDNSDAITLTGLKKIMDKADLDVGAGPRQYQECINYCINRAQPLHQPEGKTAVGIFEELGTLIVGSAVPWLSLALGSTLLSPLNKAPPPSIEARPVNAKDRDIATWLQAANKSQQTSIGKQVAPQQLAVGVRSGNQVLTYGVKMHLESCRRIQCGITLAKRDISNAHNSYYRDALLADIRALASQHPEFKPIARLANDQLSLQPQVFTRTLITGTGMEKLCKCESGGEQGSALTNSLYPLSIDLPLKQTERRHPGVKIRAFQDDMTSLGKAADMFGADKSLACLDELLEERGSFVKASKDRAYGSTQEERDNIPTEWEQPCHHYIDSDGAPAVAYGIENCGVPMGDKEYVTEWLRVKAGLIAESIDYVSTNLSKLDPHCTYTMSYLSLQTLAEFIMATNLPSETAEFAAIVNAAIQRAFACSLQVDLLDPSISESVDDLEALRDPLFVSDRAQLRAGYSGAGFRLINSREHFLNCLHNVLPHLIDRNNAVTGEITPGFLLYRGTNRGPRCWLFRRKQLCYTSKGLLSERQ